MESLNGAAQAVLRHLLEEQPTTPAKIAFAWKMVAGAAIARATEITMRAEGAVVIRARDDAWRRAVRQAKPLLLRRMQDLLGAGAIRRLDVE